jgi:hypothetical protein
VRKRPVQWFSPVGLNAWVFLGRCALVPAHRPARRSQAQATCNSRIPSVIDERAILSSPDRYMERRSGARRQLKYPSIDSATFTWSIAVFGEITVSRQLDADRRLMLPVTFETACWPGLDTPVCECIQRFILEMHKKYQNRRVFRSPTWGNIHVLERWCTANRRAIPPAIWLRLV